MTRWTSRRFLERALGTGLLAFVSCASWSFNFDPPPTPGYVVEYFNVSTGHYFYTIRGGDEQSVVDAGQAGAGWVRTGNIFQAFATLEASRYHGMACDTDPAPCRPVNRFYASGPNSHFYTANGGEVAILGRPGTGWVLEGLTFHMPVPAADGRCETLAARVPVYRLYNNRWMFNDSNHRFTASLASRQQMIADGWIDEGVALCAYGGFQEALGGRILRVPGPADIQPPGQCSDAAVSSPTSCVSVDNLPLPRHVYPGMDAINGLVTVGDAFTRRVGWAMPGRLTRSVAIVDAAPEIAASHSFVQLTIDDQPPPPPRSGSALGIHLASIDGTNTGSPSISPTLKLPTTAPAAGSDDRRFFPFRARYGTPYELEVALHVGLAALRANPGSRAHGKAFVSFQDTRSGRKLRLDAVVYGTVMEAESIGRDERTGTPTVTASFGSSSRFARLMEPAFLESTNWTMERGQNFTIRIDRAEFEALIEATRALDSALSPDPFDYVVESAGLANFVSGDGEIALHMVGPAVRSRPLP